MLQASLVNPVAKLDIKHLLKPSPSPPPSKPKQPSPSSRSISVPSSSSQYNATPSPSSTSSTCNHQTSTITTYACTQHQHSQRRQPQTQPYQLPNTAQAAFPAGTTLSNKRPLPADDPPASSSAKRSSSKWSPAEDAKVIQLRGKSMKWDDIKKELPGRSATSCRLHYQNYLERRSQWTEEKRNKLARVYERMKPALWNPIASELGVPWRAAEAMHWSLGEHEMARRANVNPFQLTADRTEHHEPGSGRVAQRDRMMESTRVFEAQDLSTIASPVNSARALGPTQAAYPPTSYYGPGPSSQIHIRPIKIEASVGSYDADDAQEDEDVEEGLKSRKRRSTGENRLPGPAELENGVPIFSVRENNRVVKAEGRRGSDGSCGSSSSSSNRSNGYEVV